MGDLIISQVILVGFTKQTQTFRIKYMKAIQYAKYGGPEVLELVEIKKPNLASDQVLVENYASSINPFDFKVRNGMIPGMPSEFPITIGGDFSGKVIEVGSNVDDFKTGDLVYGQASVFGGASGSFAEYVAVYPRSISKKPNNLDFIEAASLPLTGISAVQALEDHIELKSGQRILINGGSGGIGSIAIQIAKNKGAYVATTVSTENMEFAKSLEADRVIDYKTETLDDLKDYDAVFDTSGRELEEKLFRVLKKGGIIVSMTSKANKETAEKYEVSVISQNSETTKDRLERLRSYVELGVVKPEVDKVFDLENAPDAFLYQEESSVRGKVVVKIR